MKKKSPKKTSYQEKRKEFGLSDSSFIITDCQSERGTSA